MLFGDIYGSINVVRWALLVFFSAVAVLYQQEESRSFAPINGLQLPPDFVGGPTPSVSGLPGQPMGKVPFVVSTAAMPLPGGIPQQFGGSLRGVQAGAAPMMNMNNLPALGMGDLNPAMQMVS